MFFLKTLEFTGKKRGNNISMSYRIIKRALDILLSSFGLVALSPLFLLISLAICAESPGFPIFVQRRVGRRGRVFRCFKFRTMKCEAPGYLSKREIGKEYITKVGAFLRRNSLDELPQLLNVLAGSMSLVGPRPVIENDPGITELRKIYGVYKAKPGITGLAQICGRDRITQNEKAMLDLFYINSVCFFADFRILMHTLKNTLAGKNRGS